MLKFLLFCTLFWVSVTSQTEDQIKDDEELKEKFEQFIVDYNKQYKCNKEKAFRFSQFVNNVRKAEELNKLDEQAEFGITKFSDWTEEELNRLRGVRPNKIHNTENIMPLHKFNQGPAPAAWDWRQHNAVTPVKDQKSCGSCWIFSATENIEGQYALKHNKLLSLSEQQMVDCMDLHGCEGGPPYRVFDHLIEYGELVETESAYPYKGEELQCKYNKHHGVAKVIGYNWINATNENQVKQALYEYGPLSFCMNTHGLNSLNGGIYSRCGNPHHVDHAMLIVGYGTSDAGVDYWIVKNSWGTDWNHGGYFNMIRGKDICQILKLGMIMTSQVE